MDPWHDRVDSIVEAWLPGQAGAGGVVALEPGESTRVTFGLENRDFACWDVAADRGDGRLGAWCREGGEFVIEMGASSRDIRVGTTIDLPDLAPLVPDEKLLSPCSELSSVTAEAFTHPGGPSGRGLREGSLATCLELRASRFTQGYR